MARNSPANRFPVLFSAVILLTWWLPVATASVHEVSAVQPSHEAARSNAFRIFNAVQSAMRQWGGSVHHNGLSAYPATIPKGTLLYHGARDNEVPEVPEWLALEVEHAEMFSKVMRGMKDRWPPKKRPGQEPGESSEADSDSPPTEPQAMVDSRLAQIPLERRSHRAENDTKLGPSVRGYFHTYQANRDLRLLYLDGQSAANSDLGTLDLGDMVVRLNASMDHSLWDEWERGDDLCRAATKWGLDGIIRMEVGFEVVFCDFSNGLDLVSVLRRPFVNEFNGNETMPLFEVIRAVSHRYDGIGADRVALDFSSMVSAFFFPVNVTNPDEKRQELPRIKTNKHEDLLSIRRRLDEVLLAQPNDKESINWQGVTDMIVLRYAERIAYLDLENITPGDFISQILVVTNTYVNYPPLPDDLSLLVSDNMTTDALERCINHYDLPTTIKRPTWSPEDSLIHTAIETVTKSICSTLFEIREHLLEAQPNFILGGRNVVDERDDKLLQAVKLGQGMIRGLKSDLAWSTWKRCRSCAIDEVCFIAMFPFGIQEDHDSPSCYNAESLREQRIGYWTGLRVPP
jgi:hypothetical protein